MTQPLIEITVESNTADLPKIHQRLQQCQPTPGAIVTFTGLVRDLDNDKTIVALELEHYPGMTEKALHTIALQAAELWPLHAVVIQHRIGYLTAGEPIVAIGVASAHRRDAFDGCQFIMDYLKNDAPFWKKEIRTDGQSWIEAKQSDIDAKARWKK